MLYCAGAIETSREGEPPGKSAQRRLGWSLANVAAHTAASIRCLVVFLLETSTKNSLLHDCFHTIILVTYE
jgi:hypothetical protein